MKTVLFALIALVAIATSAEARRTYTIQSGDVPGAIPGKFAPTLKQLQEANPRVNFDTLRVGDEIVDPRPEPAELEAAKRKSDELAAQLEAATSELTTRTKQLAASRGLNAMLNTKVAELQPLADQAESYRDRFWGWVGGLTAPLVFAFIDIMWRMRVRKRLDDKIIGLQRDVATVRSEGAKAVANRPSIFDRQPDEVLTPRPSGTDDSDARH
ncbi:MAG: LysM domain-containing protein [Patescibacteria group bacterium]